MQDILIPIDIFHNKVNFTLSFSKLLHAMLTRLEKEGVKTKFDEHCLRELEQHENWFANTTSEDSISNQSLFDFIQYSLHAPIQTENLMWGVLQPTYPYCIYSTSALSDLLEKDLQVQLKPGMYVEGRGSEQLIWKVLFYSFILQNLYGFSIERNIGIVASVADKKTGLLKYFRFEVDTQYLDVTIKGQLPHLAIEDISAHDLKGTLYDYLQQKLPLNIFFIKGFATVRVKEDTTHYILEEIRTAIIHQTTTSIVETTKMVLEMLKSLVQNNAIQFGLLPFLKLNNKLVSFDLARQLSIVLNASYGQNESGFEILARLEQCYNQPKMIIVNRESERENGLLKNVFEQSQFQTIALLPIYHQSYLAGVLEIASINSGDLTKQINVFALEQVLPWLAELVHRDNMEFNNQIKEIVQAKFTSIHPSVQWKINESAFNYLKDQISNPIQAVISDIVFEEVYPLYGAVDIRNSSAIRNKAIGDDLTLRLTSLITTLQVINNELDLKIIESKLSSCYKWLDVLKTSCTGEIELGIYSFIEDEITPLLKYYLQHLPEVKKSILEYYDTIDPLTGSAGKNSRAIEKSMQFINNSINNQIEVFGNRLQRFFPSYFESFRTDGVEYDIYLGQSIAPGKQFDNLHLYEYRLLQLISMAEIARVTHSLLPRMEIPLETTQLIFVSNKPIEISFRTDEKRFDVEGSYNIKYQMIKKRIDKVNIKGTHERLTQPGTIAIIYLDAAIRREYEKYISYGQQSGYFEKEVEFLDLEEVQDVSGLKAMRLSVLHEHQLIK